MKTRERIEMSCPVHGGPWSPESVCCEQATETRESRARRRRNAARRARADIYRGLGMVRVRGSAGGTFWE